jgi:hypothetical protein
MMNPDPEGTSLDVTSLVQEMRHHKETGSTDACIRGKTMGYVSSNMINLNGPLTQIFIGFLLAIIGCVLLLDTPDLAQISYALFLIAFILVALAVVTFFQE